MKVFGTMAVDSCRWSFNAQQERRTSPSNNDPVLVRLPLPDINRSGALQFAQRRQPLQASVTPIWDEQKFAQDLTIHHRGAAVNMAVCPE